MSVKVTPNTIETLFCHYLSGIYHFHSLSIFLGYLGVLGTSIFPALDRYHLNLSSLLESPCLSWYQSLPLGLSAFPAATSKQNGPSYIMPFWERGQFGMRAFGQSGTR